MNSQLKRVTPLLAVLLLVISACAGDAAPTTTGMDDMGADFAFGEPADAEAADRTIEVVASDDFSFDPDEITVSAGETITFRVINDGKLAHDFVLGDQAAQDEHEEEMAEMEDMEHEDPNAIGLEAGETKELTWRFTEPGTVLIGCHEPGHYDSGMRGEITVEG